MAELHLDEGLSALDSRTEQVRWLIIAYAVATLATAIGQLGEITGTIAPDASGANPVLAMVVGAVFIAYAVVFLATIALVGMWIFRAHANVRVAGAGPLEISPGWAVGWFFVPIANLFKPFQAMRELWNASHNMPDGYAQDTDPNLKLWWGFWIVSNVVVNIGARTMLADRTTGLAGRAAGQSTTIIFDLIGGLLSIAAALFLWWIVREVNSAQHSTLAAASTFG